MAESLYQIKRRRVTERIFLSLTALVLLLLFTILYFVLQRDYADVRKRLRDGTMINLNDGKIGENIRMLLARGYYFTDKRDIDLIGSVVDRASGADLPAIDNIGELNKRKFFVNADEAFNNGGEVFKTRVIASRALLGFTGIDSMRFVQERTNPPELPATTNVALGAHSISGKILNNMKMPVPGVLVRLQMILPQDSVYSEQVMEVARELTLSSPGLKRVYLLDSLGHRQLQSLTAFARTDDEGRFTFLALPDDKAYELLPMQPGYQFGISQGVEELDHDVSFTFYQSPHTIRLLSTRDFNILKKERSLIVRTIEDFNKWYWIIAASLIAGFAIVHLLLTARFPEADQLILPFVMLLTGLSFLTMLSLQDPVRDRFLAKDSLLYFGMGLAGVCIMMFLNVRKATVDSGLYRLMIFKNNRKAASGWPWAFIAIILLAMTIVFGTGPEGSGVKVNLFGFQPSELVKYSIILFTCRKDSTCPGAYA